MNGTLHGKSFRWYSGGTYTSVSAMGHETPEDALAAAAKMAVEAGFRLPPRWHFWNPVPEKDRVAIESAMKETQP